jgi:hypothetical protein
LTGWATLELARKYSVDGAKKPAAAIGQIASEVVETEVEWLLEGEVARRKLHDITGNPGVGKSTMMIDTAARLTVQGLNVAMLSAEDDESDTIKPRLREACADLSRVRLVPSAFKTSNGMKPIVLPDCMSILEEAVLAEHSAALFIDPISAVLADKVDSHKDSSVRKVLAELAALAVRANCAIICLRHLNKMSAEENAMFRGGGSIAFVAAARIAFLVGYDPTDPAPVALRRRVTACVKNNLGPLPPARAFRLIAGESAKVAHVEWIAGPCLLTADDLVRSRRPRKTEALEEAIDFIQQELASGAKPVDEVNARARCAGISEATLRRARKITGARSEKTDMFGPWIMTLEKDLTV